VDSTLASIVSGVGPVIVAVTALIVSSGRFGDIGRRIDDVGKRIDDSGKRIDDSGPSLNRRIASVALDIREIRGDIETITASWAIWISKLPS
jgi:hypothetical protein